MTPKAYYEQILKAYENAGNPEIAESQRAYMRDQFEYFGLKAPVWLGILKPIMKENGLLQGAELRDFVRLCFQDEHREMHYSGLQMVEKAQRYEDESLIEFLEELITTNSWWDTVDWLAKLVGIYFKEYDLQRLDLTKSWIHGDHMWLKRVAIIFQLRYHAETDNQLLATYILACQDSTEFFIQKAMGWSLRQYSKSNAVFVIKFLESNPRLPSLTKREGMKWINKNRRI